MTSQTTDEIRNSYVLLETPFLQIDVNGNFHYYFKQTLDVDFEDETEDFVYGNIDFTNFTPKIINKTTYTKQDKLLPQPYKIEIIEDCPVISRTIKIAKDSFREIKTFLNEYQDMKYYLSLNFLRYCVANNGLTQLLHKNVRIKRNVLDIVTKISKNKGKCRYFTLDITKEVPEEYDSFIEYVTIYEPITEVLLCKDDFLRLTLKLELSSKRMFHAMTAYRMELLQKKLLTYQNQI